MVARIGTMFVARSVRQTVSIPYENATLAQPLASGEITW